MEKYEHIVSLGHFCSPAMEFEKIDRRPFSLPFDWLITPELCTVMELVDNGFQDFLNEEYMYQFKTHPQYYRNTKYTIDFYHDFSPLKSFQSQIDDVSKKYSRRIERFYDVVNRPTLFLRYITAKDAEYVSEHYEAILHWAQKFNPLNSIVFVANKDIQVKFNAEIPVYYVERDQNDSVSRAFLSVDNGLLQYILDHVASVTPKKQTPSNRYLKRLKMAYLMMRVKLKMTYHHSKLFF